MMNATNISLVLNTLCADQMRYPMPETAPVISAALFALAHSEQGQVGAALTFLDALFFSVLRFRCGGLWASVLGHGLSNTIGLTTFFLIGPVYGLW